MRWLSWISKEAISPLDRVERALHQWSSFVVLPDFALANAGMLLDRSGLEAITANGVAAGVAAMRGAKRRRARIWPRLLLTLRVRRLGPQARVAGFEPRRPPA